MPMTQFYVPYVTWDNEKVKHIAKIYPCVVSSARDAKVKFLMDTCPDPDVCAIGEPSDAEGTAWETAERLRKFYGKYDDTFSASVVTVCVALVILLFVLIFTGVIK
jgi:hypothetical protein